MQSQPVVMPPAPVMPPTGPAQVQVQIPPGLAPGQVFQVNANGQLISVTVPAGCPPGTVLAVAVPPPPAVSLQPQPAVMPPAAPQSVVEVPIPPGLTMGSVFHVQVNGMTIPVTVPEGCPPGTRLNVAGLPSARCVVKDDAKVFAFEKCRATCASCGPCGDSPTWAKLGAPDKDCQWVSRFVNRCAVVGADGTLGYESCRFACGSCDAAATC